MTTTGFDGWDILKLGMVIPSAVVTNLPLIQAVLRMVPWDLQVFVVWEKDRIRKEEGTHGRMREEGEKHKRQLDKLI